MGLNRSKNMPKIIKITFAAIAVLLVLTPFSAAGQSIGREDFFNIDSYYDLHDRQEIPAVLVKLTDKLYFYADKDWWQGLESSERQSLEVTFYNMSVEFEKRTYPELTSVFGPEPDPDKRTTVLIHPMIREAGGYFNSGDVYSAIQYPKSNERKMVYLNSRHIGKTEADYFLAHEFMHLITANQKDLLRGIAEEVWLNEARAEYTATILGHDDTYKGSNLMKRVNDFLADPRVSLTEWLNKKEDYGVVNLFTQYLVDHYGVKILVDSLQSGKTGIESINHALAKQNYDKDFSDIFTDWAIALLVNDCSLGEKYCYLNEHLQSLRVTPTFYYLPRSKTVLSSQHSTTYWALNWHRFMGGQGNLVLNFNGGDRVEFAIPYLICRSNNDCSVDFIDLDKEQKGQISFSDFGAEYSSLTLMPFIKSKTEGFNGKESSISFSWDVAIGMEEKEEKGKSELISQLSAHIENLRKQTVEHKAKISALLSDNGSFYSCQIINSNLSSGITNSAEVRCLQEFLKAQGPDIYPQGLITGNFFALTQQAVVRFQEKYASEILFPLGLQRGTGYVGASTRAKINQLMGSLSLLGEENEMVKEILDKIELLEKEIKENQLKLDSLLSDNGSFYSCQIINSNLSSGITNSAEVRCLQEFLKAQGPDIYPQGLITGNFFALTQQAVVRFQEKYASEILFPLGLQRGTGYVGASTRAKINELLR